MSHEAWMRGRDGKECLCKYCSALRARAKSICPHCSHRDVDHYLKDARCSIQQTNNAGKTTKCDCPTWR